MSRGIVAAAVVMAPRAVAGRDEPPAVRADRPFARAVIESGTGVPLFAGVVADPRIGDAS